MKKIIISLLMAVMLIYTGCNLDGYWRNNDVEEVSLAVLIESELLNEYDVDTAIEEEIEISVPITFSKSVPGPNPQRNRKRINLNLKHEIDSLDVSHTIEYTDTDTALVTVIKTRYATMYIHHSDTTVTDTPVVWEKNYVYTSTAYWQFVRFDNADSSRDSASNIASDSSGWRLTAKSPEVGETAEIMNTIEYVLLTSDAGSDDMLFDDPAALYPVFRGYIRQGYFRERPGTLSTNVFVGIDGNDDVNVLGSSGRHFALKDDGLGIDLTEGDNIYSGTVLKGRGQSRLRVQMITTATFTDEDAPVEMTAWFLPIR
ncbi:MAG: hypothetical protein K0B52_04900 [FCB group bacterium]|nr:hypothetical protein [FCB group bacterium]